MRFKSFSETQLKALSWWSDSSPYRDLDAVICDGAVRSGKTMCMGISFVCWAMRRFHNERFGICGKAKTGIRRNLLDPLLPVSVIGRVTEKGTGIVYLTDRDGKKRLFAKGYDHFGDS